MTRRSRSVLAVVALLFLAGCAGGGGANTTPLSAGPLTTAANTASTYASAVAQSAPSGVRTFVHLPLRNSDQLDSLIEQQSTKGSPLYGHWLTPAQFRDTYGPAAADLQSAAAALQASGFKTTITSQTIIADAPQAIVERTFAIHLRPRTESVMRQAVSTLAADRAPTVPAALARFNPQILAFAPVHLHHPDHMVVPLSDPDNRYGPIGGYWFDDLKEAYRYPAYDVARGQGRTIAILSAGDFLDSDIALYFGHEHLAVPAISREAVNGGPPPFDPNSNTSVESTLDVQQAGGSAPGAKIVVYGVPDASDVSFISAYLTMAEDDTADVVSTSFGICELYYKATYNDGQDFTYLLQIYHDVFRQMNTQGMTLVNSSGDFGALGCTDTSFATATLGVDASGDDPDVTAVGGTNLVTTHVKDSLESNYVRENAFYDKFAADSGYPSGEVWGSGGGKSVFFSKPTYQRLVNTHTSARAVPDVSMHMGGCPVGSVLPCATDRSYDLAYFGGTLFGLVGTSASAPEFAGLQAIQDGVLGNRQGNVNFLLYALAASNSFGNGPIFNEDIPGNDGYYSTSRGYNFVLGNGTVNGAQYAVEPFGPFAGNPRTPTNP